MQNRHKEYPITPIPISLYFNFLYALFCHGYHVCCYGLTDIHSFRNDHVTVIK